MTPEQSIEYLQLHLATLYNGGLALKLIDAFGDAGETLQADSEKLLEIEGMSPDIVKRLRCGKTKTRARKEWDRCRSAGAGILLCPAPSYPTALR